MFQFNSISEHSIEVGFTRPYLEMLNKCCTFSQNAVQRKGLLHGKNLTRRIIAAIAIFQLHSTKTRITLQNSYK